MWVWIWPSAEVVALDSVALGDAVTWSCREGTRASLVLPPEVDRTSVLIEDSDYAHGTDHDFVEVNGRVIGLNVANDQWHRVDEGWWEITPGTRVWRAADDTRDATLTPMDGGPSGYLIELKT